MSIDSRSNQYGKLFGDWNIKKKLANGSSGTSVYQIVRTDLNVEEVCALKVVPLICERGDYRELSEERKKEYQKALNNRRANASKEVSLMIKLRGRTNIVDYLNFTTKEWEDEGEFGCDLLISMELLHDLRSELKHGRSFSEDEIVKIGIDICRALVVCHGKNIIHRDIKPENIFYNDDLDYKLGDFGISRILDKCHSAVATTATGTPAYLAPEQIQREYDERVDVYSLGLVLYELSNGNRLPFATSSYITNFEIQERMLGKQLPVPCNASTDLANVILKACAYNASERYQTAQEMLEALKKVSKENTEPIEEPPAPVDPWNQNNTIPTDPSGGSSFVTIPPTPVDTDSHAKLRARAEAGDAFSQNKLGENYCFGRGVSVDHEQAVLWFRKAANQGNAEGQYNLGYCYELGKGVSADIRQAKSLYQKAAEQGHVQARQRLIDMKPRDVEWKPNVYTILASSVALLLLIIVLWPKHSHTWEEATCVQPRTCTECGKTEGEPLDHTPTELSCTSAALCTECGAVVQDAPGHQWTESDTGVKICSVCQAIDRESRNAQILSDAESYAETGQYREAIRILDEAWKETGEQAFFDLAGDYRMAFGISNTSYVAAGKYNSVLIKDDGSVVVVGDDEYSELEAKYWSDIVAVSAGDRHIVGLRSNGTVVSVGSNDVGQRDVDFWSDVVAIAAGDVHTIALLKDGTLRAAGHLWAPRCDVDGLYNRAGNKRIVSIAAGYLHTLALLEDGTVIASGENGYKQCDVENWTDIAAIYAGTYFSLGLRTDGSVVKAGITDWNISGWTNMINLAAGDFFAVGITSEGTLLSAGMDNAIGPNTPKTISTWKNIAQISAGNDHIIALTGNGKTRCAGKNDYKQINLDSFTVTYPNAVAGTGTNSLPATAHSHTWQDATCTQPKTCLACGITVGQVTGHVWIPSPTSDSKICSVCGATEGNSILDIVAGDTIFMGYYGNETIVWTVLEFDPATNQALLISEYCLDAMPFHTGSDYGSWENSTLRKWLNNEFISKAFDQEERAAILTKTISNPDNADYGTDSGKDTTDRVFLLSYEEAVYYFPSKTSRQGTPTEYCKEQGCYDPVKYGQEHGTEVSPEAVGHTWWWLRTAGADENQTCNVVAKGSASTYGARKTSDDGAVRPAMWVQLG